MQQNRWLMLAVLFLARTTMALQFQTVGSLGPDLVDALAIDYALLGTLIGLYMLPGIFIALPGGLMGQRFGAKAAALAGLALMVVGGFLTGTSALWLVAAGRLIAGAGAVLVNVMLTKMVVDWFDGREIVTAMAILIASWPLGIGLSLISAVPLSAAYGWTSIMNVATVAVVVGFVLIAVLYREAPSAAVIEARRLALNLSRREWLLVAIAGLVWATYNVAYVVFASFAPAFFASRGYSPAQGSMLTSIASWSLIASIPAGGYLAERWRTPNLFMIGALLLSAVAVVALVASSVTVVAFIAIVLVVGVPAGLIMALPAEALRPETRAAGMGVFYTLYYGLMAVLPGIAGIVRDRTASAGAPLLFVAAMLLAALVFLLAGAAPKDPRRARTMTFWGRLPLTAATL
jgi:cyanate permease